ncbi:metal ABC transporter substrate-binding protein [Pollutimonas subterranea]|uniref:Metal ABC transporter substrate-binding protein n=1 Tax=Pollutimonas subterranea TaxID=2045210 RepID=A0A2N4U2T5_9BURK|nr:metal ABC transporter substrate-binding protein [Pollutimonas subterranea]
MAKTLGIQRFSIPGRRRILAALAGGALAMAAPFAWAADGPLRVVASFSIIGDMVKEIGGEHVALTTIVGPNGDAHSFEPTPRDVQALSQAQVLVINGMDFEGWLPRLIKAADFEGAQVLASKGVTPRQLNDAAHGKPSHDGHDHHGDDDSGHVHHGDVDPHAWQSLGNGMIYAENIADGLSLADPENQASYKKRAQAYIEKMKALDVEIRQALDAIPADKRKVITSHDAFGYFAQDYGIQFLSIAGFSSKAEPSARDVAAIVDLARKEGIAGVFIENTTNAKLVEQVARETKAKVGGTLYSDALAPADQPAATYLGMFTWNAGQLLYVLQPTQ